MGGGEVFDKDDWYHRNTSMIGTLMKMMISMILVMMMIMIILIIIILINCIDIEQWRTDVFLCMSSLFCYIAIFTCVVTIYYVYCVQETSAISLNHG